MNKVLPAADTSTFAEPAILPGDEMVGVRALLSEDHQRLRATFSLHCLDTPQRLQSRAANSVCARGRTHTRLEYR